MPLSPSENIVHWQAPKSVKDFPGHHQLVLRLPPAVGGEEGEFRTDFLGIKIRKLFEASMEACDKSGCDARSMPQSGGERASGPAFLPCFDEEYFEWIDLLESVVNARDVFVMMELGAGYGRWLIRAANALRILNPIPSKLVGVEAEPTHYAWMSQHFRDNEVNPEEHRLIPAAVAGAPGKARFYFGNSNGWYGQSLVSARTRLRQLAFSLVTKLGHGPLRESLAGTSIGTVQAVGLESLLDEFARVDLVDLDVQGAEFEILSSSIEILNRKVVRVHIGTHSYFGSHAIEYRLRRLFRAHDWVAVHDWPCQSTQQTPYGEIHFGDGVQTWINPRLSY